MTMFETYLLFKIDDIIKLCGLIGFLSFLTFAIYVFLVLIMEFVINWKVITWGGLIFLLAFTCSVASELLPSRNTIIAMKVIPMLTTDENMKYMSDETKELYELFKDYIKSEIKTSIEKNKKGNPKTSTETTNDDMTKFLKDTIKSEIKEQIKK